MLTTATTNPITAANGVAAARTPRRPLTLRDEFGPFRGRKVLERDVEVLDIDVDEVGRSSHRAQLAWVIAG